MGDRKLRWKVNFTARNLFSLIDKHQSSIILLLVFLLNLLLVSPELMTNYSSINPDDEAKYVDSGWRLLGGDIPLARQETRRLFGTQEENHSSILRAIMRNPPAFAARIFANAKTIPLNYLNIFGKKLGPVLLLFSIAGVYSLVRKKTRGIVAILLIWPVHALVALGFLSLHIIPQTIYLPLLLGAIGITEIFNIEADRVEKLVFLLSTLLLLAISWSINKPALLISFLLLGFALLVHWLSSSSVKLKMKGLHIYIFLLLAASLILREPFQFPNFPDIGKSPVERAVHYMEVKLPTLSTVLVPTPLPAIVARMSYLTMDNLPVSINSIPEFADYLQQNQVTAIYLDSNLRGRYDIYDLMEQGTVQYFTLGYTSQDKTIRIFLVK